MKPPPWIVLQPPHRGTKSDDGRSVVYTFRIRLWHPGLWLELVRYWWANRGDRA